jgi:hypothetical protein
MSGLFFRRRLAGLLRARPKSAAAQPWAEQSMNGLASWGASIYPTAPAMRSGRPISAIDRRRRQHCISLDAARASRHSEPRLWPPTTPPKRPLHPTPVSRHSERLRWAQSGGWGCPLLGKLRSPIQSTRILRRPEFCGRDGAGRSMAVHAALCAAPLQPYLCWALRPLEIVSVRFGNWCLC